MSSDKSKWAAWWECAKSVAKQGAEFVTNVKTIITGIPFIVLFLFRQPNFMDKTTAALTAFLFIIGFSFLAFMKLKGVKPYKTYINYFTISLGAFIASVVAYTIADLSWVVKDASGTTHVIGLRYLSDNVRKHREEARDIETFYMDGGYKMNEMYAGWSIWLVEIILFLLWYSQFGGLGFMLGTGYAFHSQMNSRTKPTS